jgi:hypothetical protein
MITECAHPAELLACPQCGSEWFVSSRSGERIIFQIDTDRLPLTTRSKQQPKDTVPLNPDRICCGACTWQDTISRLVESRM